jgi:hypothetical protein
LDDRDDRLSLVVEEVHTQTSESDDKSLGEKEMTIIIPKGIGRESLRKISDLLKNNQGRDKIKICIQNSGEDKIIHLPYTVNFSPEVKLQVEKLLSP